MTERARGRTAIRRMEEVSAPSVGDTLVLGDGDRTGQIVNLCATLGKRPYVMVVNWVDTGHVGLVFPGPDVSTYGAEYPR